MMGKETKVREKKIKFDIVEVLLSNLGSIANLLVHLTADPGVTTLHPLYNTVNYNTVLDITWFKDGS